MLTPHPTLRRTDIFPQRGNDLRAWLGQDALHLTYNARGGFFQLLRAIPQEKGSVVLLPAFHCTALVEPVAQSSFRAVFYRIKPDFSIDLDDLRSKLTSDVALIVVIHFFGFPTGLSGVMDLARRAGCFVLEDCAHSFLTSDSGRAIGHQGDFAIYSYYKTVASMFGGGLRINRRSLDFSASRKKISFKESAVITKRLLEQVVDNSQDGFLKRGLQSLEQRRVKNKQASFQSGEQPAVSGFVDDPYLFRGDLALAQIPAVCKRIVKSSDWQAIAATRRRNYEILGRTIEETSFLKKPFPALPQNICPWAFPVLLRDRARYEHALRDRGVPLFTFGEVLHPLLQEANPATRADAEFLSSQLLMLPVHQNLAERDVADYATQINRWVSEMEISFRRDAFAAVPQPINAQARR